VLLPISLFAILHPLPQVRVYRGLVRHAAQPGRGTRHPVNGGAHVSGDE
jgi:hypothetical protein